MKWEIRIEKKAQKELARAPLDQRKRIISTLPLLAENPFVGKKLIGTKTGLFSYRVWPYRIIYKVYRQKILVVIIRIGHRQGVYDE